ncbi:MAG: hypothetical protein ACOX14_08270 [Fermentimonas caenicola]
MKKLSLLIVALLLFTVAGVQAQSEGGDFAKRGAILLNPQLLNVSYQSMKINSSDSDASDGEKLSQLGLSVSGGYAIADNLFILAQVAGQSLQLGSDDATKVSFFTIGAGARYYIGKFFLGGGVLANNGKINIGGYFDDFDDMEVSGDDLSTTIIGYRAEAGYAIFLTPSVALEPSISYGGKLAGGAIKVGGEKMDSKLEYSQFGINLGVSIFF